MFALVDDIESYPEFLPWCSDAEVHLREGDIAEATLELHRGGIRKRFRTRNTATGSSAIDMALIGGPFKHLDGGWRFQALGDAGCKVTLDIEFEFSVAIVDRVFGTFFEDVCNRLVDAFTQRADVVYGAIGRSGG